MTQRDRNPGSRTSVRQKSSGKALQPETHGEPIPSTASPSRQMLQDGPGFSHGTSRPAPRAPSQQGTGASSHPGQLGYSQGGGAHDNWGAFDGNQQRQSPGYGQEEPWQHQHDADYLRWREEHLRQLDEEYATWRRDRYGKFSEEFSQWRDSRRSTSSDEAASSQRTPEANDKSSSRERRTSLHGKLK